MSRRNSLIFSTLFCLATSFGLTGAGLAQGPGMGPGPGMGMGPGMGPGRPPMERVFHDHRFGRWWNDPRLAQQIGLTDEQKHRMDDIFLQHRLKLIDLNANLEKQEIVLRPMIEADQMDEAKILSQIDAIAQSRADLEKANARMLFDIRKVITPEQWKKLKALREERRPDGMMRRGPDGRGQDGRGPARWQRPAPPAGSQAPPPPPAGGGGPEEAAPPQ